jgi:hypothetical protein
LPRQLVASQATFDLVLGSTYRLRAVHLERATSAGFETVQTLTPSQTPRFVLTDELTASGVYSYRARLETASGRSITTQTEKIYLAGANDLLVFPNPVTAGQKLTLLEGQGRAMHWQLYDQVGRFVREMTVDEAAINEIATNGLRAGTYTLRIQPTDGPVVFRRIVVL